MDVMGQYESRGRKRRRSQHCLDGSDIKQKWSCVVDECDLTLSTTHVSKTSRVGEQAFRNANQSGSRSITTITSATVPPRVIDVASRL